MSIGSIASNIWAQTTQLSSYPDDALTTASASSSATGTQGSSTSAAAGQTGSVDPFQQLATDIQAMLVQAQGGASQTASAEQTGATGQAHGHHHHHHEDTDTDASAATEASATTTSPGSTASANTQTVAQALAADMVQALSAYGGAGTTSAASGLTA